MTDEEMLAIRRAILADALPNVPFDGWSGATLRQATTAAGHDPAMAARAFPGGAIELLAFWLSECDRVMLAGFDDPAVRKLKLRDKMAAAIRRRLDHVAAHEEAVRRALNTLALPQHAPQALRSLHRTVDALWYAVGDRSTDFNFYTKRAMLAAIYSATLVYWLDDRSPDKAQSWAFLERRLDGIMRFQKWRGKLDKTVEKLPFGLGRALGRSPT
jgi:ubiquinone biosynthesis protein COQ9